MKKPKCPWKPPFKFTAADKENWPAVEDANRKVVVHMEPSIYIHDQPYKALRVITYALNATYKPKKARKK